jgi:hypothetical protein
MRKLSGTSKLTRAVALVSLFAWLPVTAIAQQPANQPSAGSVPAGALISGAAGAALAAEGERKAIILTLQNDNLVAEYHYYWWRGGCYLRYQSGSYQAVALDACS